MTEPGRCKGDITVTFVVMGKSISNTSGTGRLQRAALVSELTKGVY